MAVIPELESEPGASHPPVLPPKGKHMVGAGGGSPNQPASLKWIWLQMVCIENKPEKGSQRLKDSNIEYMEPNTNWPLVPLVCQ